MTHPQNGCRSVRRRAPPAEMDGDEPTGYTLRLAPALAWCREARRDTDTGSSAFQGGGGENETEVCESATEVIRL